MKKTLYSLIFILLALPLWGQNVSVICNIPSILDENSGMLISNSNRIWLHNDGGDSAKLYAIDTNGTILRTILMQNATNYDWEDITQDTNGNVYVGDFGNNNNNRQNLRIYKIPHPDSIVGPTVQAQEIKFYYPEQTAFPAPDYDKNYDAEALLYYNDSLYIFTKDRTVPHQGYTRMYQLPADTGTHAALLVDSFPTGQMNFIFEITGASLSADQSKMALINLNKIWVFSNFSGHDFFGGTMQVLNLGFPDQKEALDFVSNTEIYFSNERSSLSSPKLYRLEFSPVLNTSKIEVLNNLELYPNPTREKINLSFDLEQAQKVKIQLFDSNGRCVQQLQKEQLPSGKNQLSLTLDKKLVSGVYFVKMKIGKQKITKRVLLTD